MNHSGIFPRVLLTVLFFTMASQIFALVDIPDNGIVREEMLPLVIAPVNELNPGLNTIYESDYLLFRVKFEVLVDTIRNATFVMFINERNGEFPMVGPGNLFIQRNRSNGIFEQVKLFLGSDPHVFLKFFPSGRRVEAQLFIYDDANPVAKGIMLPMEMNRFLELSTDRILSYVYSQIDLEQFVYLNEPSLSSNTMDFISQIRSRLPDLPDAEDGAMDQYGNLVAIETLLPNGLPGFNCSGFAKWISDGIYHSYSGSYLNLDDLKEKHLERRGSPLALFLEDQRDPYFGLDWIRNIAISLESQRTGRIFDNYEAMDVRSVPFHEYVEDVGYPVDELWQIMYFLAKDHENNFYLASINGTFGTEPQLWQHYHIALLFPFFDDYGILRVAVFERNVETSINSLFRRYDGEYIHLVRAYLPQEVELPQIRINPN